MDSVISSPTHLSSAAWFNSTSISPVISWNTVAESSSGINKYDRGSHTAVWTGSQMIIWGGMNTGSTLYNTGGIYDPTHDSWSATSTGGAPVARYNHGAVWTGSVMLLWGGAIAGSNAYTNTGVKMIPE